MNLIDRILPSYFVYINDCRISNNQSINEDYQIGKIHALGIDRLRMSAKEPSGEYLIFDVELLVDQEEIDKVKEETGYDTAPEVPSFEDYEKLKEALETDHPQKDDIINYLSKFGTVGLLPEISRKEYLDLLRIVPSAKTLQYFGRDRRASKKPSLDNSMVINKFMDLARPLFIDEVKSLFRGFPEDWKKRIFGSSDSNMFVYALQTEQLPAGESRSGQAELPMAVDWESAAWKLEKKRRFYKNLIKNNPDSDLAIDASELLKKIDAEREKYWNSDNSDKFSEYEKKWSAIFAKVAIDIGNEYDGFYSIITEKFQNAVDSDSITMSNNIGIWETGISNLNRWINTLDSINKGSVVIDQIHELFEDAMGVDDIVSMDNKGRVYFKTVEESSFEPRDIEGDEEKIEPLNAPGWWEGDFKTVPELAKKAKKKREEIANYSEYDQLHKQLQNKLRSDAERLGNIDDEL